MQFSVGGDTFRIIAVSVHLLIPYLYLTACTLKNVEVCDDYSKLTCDTQFGKHVFLVLLDQVFV